MGRCILVFNYPERNLPIRKGMSKGELLKLYRQMAFYHVPVEFREELSKHLRSKRVFFLRTMVNPRLILNSGV